MQSENKELLLHRIAWSQLTEPNDQSASKLIEHFGYVEALALIRESSKKLLQVDINPSQIQRIRERIPIVSPNQQLALANTHNLTVISPEHPCWPTAVQDLGYPPRCLWVKGQPEVLLEPKIAVVGARACSSYGEQVAGDFGYQIAVSGFQVVSGGAYGIDIAGHKGALAATGGTIVVLAGGIDKYYPRGHSQIFENCTQAGAVISEYPLGIDPTRYRFLARNRLIAALSYATVVVEAARRSGAIVTVREAEEISRLTFAVPGNIFSALSQGCHDLLKLGVNVATSVEDILTLLPSEVGARAQNNSIAKKENAGKAKNERAKQSMVNYENNAHYNASTRVIDTPSVDKKADRSFRSVGILDGIPQTTARVLDVVSPNQEVTLEHVMMQSGLGGRQVIKEIAILEIKGRVIHTSEGWKRAR